MKVYNVVDELSVYSNSGAIDHKSFYVLATFSEYETAELYLDYHGYHKWADCWTFYDEEARIGEVVYIVEQDIMSEEDVINEFRY